MKKMKKVLACTMAAAMAAALTACGGSGDSETPAAASSESKSEAAEAKTEEAKSEASGDKVTVTFWDENAGDQRTEFYMEIIEKFEEENPEYPYRISGTFLQRCSFQIPDSNRSR